MIEAAGLRVEVEEVFELYEAVREGGEDSLESLKERGIQ